MDDLFSHHWPPSQIPHTSHQQVSSSKGPFIKTVVHFISLIPLTNCFLFLYIPGIISMPIYIYTWDYQYAHICIYLGLSVYTHVYTWDYQYAHIYIYIYIYTWDYQYAHICIYLGLSVCPYMYIPGIISMPIYVYTWDYQCAHICIYLG